MNALRTALVVVVDRAVPLVDDVRRRFDPAVHRRMPVHVDLVSRTVGRFPEHPPCGGVFDAAIPHLTIASGEAVDEGEVVARRELDPHLPIAARAVEVTLLQEQPDQTWVARAAFPLEEA